MSKHPSFLNKAKKTVPEIRSLKEMQPVLYDQKWFKQVKNPGKTAVYYIFRKIKKENNLRYDITVIPGKMLGREFPKTKGHRHIGKIPELVKILQGKAIYLFQKSEGKNIKNCYIVKAQKNDIVIIPLGYDHLTINPSKNKLVMANWILEKAKNDYSFFDRLEGACYYYTKNGWVKNENYKKIPKLKTKKPLKSMPESLEFLKGNG